MLHTIVNSVVIVLLSAFLGAFALGLVGVLSKIADAITGLISAVHVQTYKLTNPAHGLILSPEELAILSKLLRGWVVGPAARDVLEKVHMFGEQGKETRGPVN